jgi:hypothetical protein
MLKKNKITNGIIAGLILAVIDVLLVYFADPNWTISVLLQVFIAWFGIGFVVVNSETRHNPFVHSLLITLLLVLPWIILYSTHPYEITHGIPMLVQAVIFSIVLGYFKKKSA